MTRKERYRIDPEYRAQVNKINRDAYQRNIKRPGFVRANALRARINNARVSLRHHEDRAAFFFNRIGNDLKLLAKLKDKK